MSGESEGGGRHSAAAADVGAITVSMATTLGWDGSSRVVQVREILKLEEGDLGFSGFLYHSVIF